MLYQKAIVLVMIARLVITLHEKEASLYVRFSR